jgi:hypothetical protein
MDILLELVFAAMTRLFPERVVRVVTYCFCGTSLLLILYVVLSDW